MEQKSAGVGDRQSYPEDRFDRVRRTGRVGAHRVTARPRYVWHFVIAGLIGFAVLTAVGVFAVHSIGESGKLPLQGATTKTAAPKRVVPQLDPEATVAVLNGSETVNLAAALDKIIADEQWGQILFSGGASSQDVTISAVFYSDPADAESAAGLAAKLGGLSTYTTNEYDEYGAQLIVLLGSDYAGPGIEEAAAMTAAGGDLGDTAGGIAVDPEQTEDPETPAEQPVE